ncbi:MAG: hypothetical protein ACR2NP_08725, partial [Pirellulaceae bacterium]
FKPLVMLKSGFAGHLNWDELTEDLISEQLQINQITGETALVSGPETNSATGHTTRNIRSVPKLRRVNGDDDENTEDATDGDGEDSESSKSRGRLDDFTHVLAAHVEGKPDQSKVNVVVIADVDFVSDLFYLQRDNVETPLDNYTFFVNAIEVLAGDESLVRLRNRRPVPRTLTTIERMTEPFKLQAVDEQENAEALFNEKMQEAEDRSKARDEELEANEEMSVAERSTRSVFSRLNEETRLIRQSERLQTELDERIEAIQSDQQRKTQSVESWVRWLAILSAGLPALFLGSIVLLIRTSREQRQIDPQRRV